MKEEQLVGCLMSKPNEDDTRDLVGEVRTLQQENAELRKLLEETSAWIVPGYNGSDAILERILAALEAKP